MTRLDDDSKSSVGGGVCLKMTLRFRQEGSSLRGTFKPDDNGEPAIVIPLAATGNMDSKPQINQPSTPAGHTFSLPREVHGQGQQPQPQPLTGPTEQLHTAADGHWSGIEMPQESFFCMKCGFCGGNVAGSAEDIKHIQSCRALQDYQTELMRLERQNTKRFTVEQVGKTVDQESHEQETGTVQEFGTSQTSRSLVNLTLLDYQQQLMRLERQNKERLLAARKEQL